jgi:hypothetical protein
MAVRDPESHLRQAIEEAVHHLKHARRPIAIVGYSPVDAALETLERALRGVTPAPDCLEGAHPADFRLTTGQPEVDPVHACAAHLPLALSRYKNAQVVALEQAGVV